MADSLEQAKRKLHKIMSGRDSKPKFNAAGGKEAAKKRAEESLKPKKQIPPTTDLIEGKRRLAIILDRKKQKVAEKKGLLKKEY